jgi:quercetin dioxygenase-like cupin family protein
VIVTLLVLFSGFGLPQYVLLWIFVHKSRIDRAKETAMTEPILNMKELVAYQNGSIVSKEIIKKQTGTVTIFAFDRDQGLSEHTAPFDALVYVLDGEAEISIMGEPHLLNEGEIIIMPGGKPHSLKALKKFKMMLVMVRS